MLVDAPRSKIFLTPVDATSKQYDDQVWTFKDVDRRNVLAREASNESEGLALGRNDRHLNEVPRQRRKKLPCTRSIFLKSPLKSWFLNASYNEF